MKDDSKLLVGHLYDDFMESYPDLIGNQSDTRRPNKPVEKPYVNIEIDVHISLCCYWYFTTRVTYVLSLRLTHQHATCHFGFVDVKMDNNDK